MLALWLRDGSSLTRKSILDALRRESVGESQLADRLYKKYTTTSNKVSMMGGAGAEICDLRASGGYRRKHAKSGGVIVYP